MAAADAIQTLRRTTPAMVVQSGIRNTPLADPRILGGLMRGAWARVVTTADHQRVLRYHYGTERHPFAKAHPRRARKEADLLRQNYIIGAFLVLGLLPQLEEFNRAYLLAGSHFHSDLLINLLGIMRSNWPNTDLLGRLISSVGLSERFHQQAPRSVSGEEVIISAASRYFAGPFAQCFAARYLAKTGFGVETSLNSTLRLNAVDSDRWIVLINEPGRILSLLFRSTTAAVVFSGTQVSLDEKFTGYQSCQPLISDYFSAAVSHDVLATLVNIARTCPKKVSEAELANLARCLRQEERDRQRFPSGRGLHACDVDWEGLKRECLLKLDALVADNFVLEPEKIPDYPKARRTIKKIERIAQRHIVPTWEGLLAA